MYFGPQSIGRSEGANCDHCYKFIVGGRCIEVDGAISGASGICGLYINGDPRGADPGFRLRRVSKQEASYAEVGPTHCLSCEYYGGRQQESGLCQKVEGVVAARGCCNLYEPGDNDVLVQIH
jgi:hypothetical protein